MIDLVASGPTVGEWTEFQRLRAGIAVIVGVICLIGGAFSHMGYAPIWLGWLGRKGQSLLLGVVGVLCVAWVLIPARKHASDVAVNRCRTWLQNARDSAIVLNTVPDSSLRYGRHFSSSYTCRQLLR
jgi:hypothetical protein